jgi:hypothetical protein
MFTHGWFGVPIASVNLVRCPTTVETVAFCERTACVESVTELMSVFTGIAWLAAVTNCPTSVGRNVAPADEIFGLPVVVVPSEAADTCLASALGGGGLGAVQENGSPVPWAGPGPFTPGATVAPSDSGTLQPDTVAETVIVLFVLAGANVKAVANLIVPTRLSQATDHLVGSSGATAAWAAGAATSPKVAVTITALPTLANFLVNLT